MVKVCHMTSAHNSDDTRIFYKECTSLAAAGYETYLVARGESREENGVHVVGLGEAPASRRKRMTSFAKAVYQKALSLDCEIYHLHDPELLPYGVKLKKQGKKVIFDSHENYIEQIKEKYYLPIFVRKISSMVYGEIETRIVRKLDAVVVPCTFSGKNIFEGRVQKTVYIANYSLLNEFYEKYDPTIKRDGYVCYTGTMADRNGIPDLISAAAKVAIPVVLAGEKTKYISQLEEMDGLSNIDYRGVVNREEIFQIFQKATIGAYVNRHEGQNGIVDTFGIKVYEYMSMGLPIVVDKTTYSEYVIDKYRCGLCVEQGNVDAIADAFRYIIGHSEEAKRMGENGRRAVKEEFNWGIEEKKLLGLYEELIG